MNTHDMPPVAISVLLADDDEEDLELFQAAVTKVNSTAKVKTVLNGRLALEYLQQCRDKELPCLIILDYNMPEMNGVDLLDRLRPDERFKNIPKLILSTSNAQSHVRECLDHGAANYFVKPNNMRDLEALAADMLTYCTTSQDL
ncbi:MAG TPA: response regulator [Flavisolibacter sp.]|nr:response regulator [Flavisolibacter sp.]